MTPRVPPVAEPDAEQARLLAKSRLGPDGEPLNVFRTLVRWPELMRRVNALGGYFRVHGRIDPRDRELVILRTAARTESAYETAQHRWIARECGLTQAEIEAALDRTNGHAWSDRQRALLSFTDELVATDGVSDPTWVALGRHFDDEQRTELVVLVGYYRLLAGVIAGLGVQVDDAVLELLAGTRAGPPAPG